MFSLDTVAKVNCLPHAFVRPCFNTNQFYGVRWLHAIQFAVIMHIDVFSVCMWAFCL